MDMPDKIWADIPGYDLYQVSNMGKIRNKKTLREIKGRDDNKGYLKFCAWGFGDKSKTLKFHKAIHLAFFNGQDGLINHKDGNKHNNCLDNLEVVSARENVSHGKTARGKNTGAVLHKPSGLWASRICIDGKSKSLGYFKTAEAASGRYFKELEVKRLENKYAK